MAIPTDREPAPRAQRVLWVRVTPSAAYTVSTRRARSISRPAVFSVAFVEGLLNAPASLAGQKIITGSDDTEGVNRP